MTDSTSPVTNPLNASPPARPVVLVVGSGYVGGALARCLAADHEVLTLRRSAGPPGSLQRDVSRPFDLPSEPRLDSVVYLVGADGRTPEAYRRAYEAGPTELLAALARAGQQPRRIVYASSTSVHGQANGEIIDDRSAAEPTSFSGHSVLAGEHVFAAGPWPVTRVRFAGIYGPGRDSFVRGVIGGTLGLSDANPHTNRIHLDDCVGVLVHLLAHEAAPPVVLASDPAPTRRNEVVSWLAAQAGVEPVRQVAGASERRPAGDRRCHPAWLLADGYRYRHPDFRSGYAALVAALRR